jgi:hypothetical protein
MDDNCSLALRAMAMHLRSWFAGQAGDEGDSEVESESDQQDFEMEDAEEVDAVALPSKKGTKRKAPVLIAEQPQADLQPPPAKQAHLQVIQP